MVCCVFRSNYSISGFTEEVSIKELSEIKENYETVLIHDLGSGLVVDRKFLEINHIDIFNNETSVQNSLMISLIFSNPRLAIN